MLRPLGSIRSFNTFSKLYSRGRNRNHVKIVNKTIPKPPISRINPKPITKTQPRETTGIPNDVKDSVMKWNEYLNQPIGEGSLSLVNEIYKYTQDIEKCETLNISIKNYLKNEILKYDLMNDIEETGMPEEIKEAIYECRDLKDNESLLKVYEFYFKLLFNTCTLKHVSYRNELIEKLGIGGEEEGLEEGLEQVSGDTSRIEEEWYKVEEPRNLRIYFTSYNKLVERINKDISKFNIKFVNDFIKDIVNSEMKFEYNELEMMMANIMRFERLNEGMYEKLKVDIVGNMGMSFNVEIYKIFLNGSLKNRDYKLFAKILGDFEDDGYLIDREIFGLLIRYYSLVKDTKKFDKLIEWEVKVGKIGLFTKDMKNVIDSLVRIGKRGESVEIIKMLCMIGDGEGKDYDEFGNVEKMFSSSGSRDSCLVSKVDIKQVVGTVLASSESLQECENLERLVLQVSDLGWEMAKIGMFVRYDMGNFEGDEGYGEFQKYVVKLFETMEMSEIEKMVMDDEFLQGVGKITEREVELVGEDDDEMAKAWGDVVGRRGDVRQRIKAVLVVSGVDVDVDTV